MKYSPRSIAKIAMQRLRHDRKSAHFRRNLSMRDAGRLAEDLSQILEQPFTEQWVQEKAQLIRTIESRMIGRIAGDIEDYILNYTTRFVVASTSQRVNQVHAEIGTLFGGSVLLSLFAIDEARSADHVLAIDPFFGYYGQDLDIVTRLPVTAGTVRDNIAKFGFDLERVEIVSATSQSEEAIKAAASYPLASLFIDGDHSYKGVESDWINYHDLVSPGGYVLFDNYNDAYWPEITQFVSEQLAILPEKWANAGTLNHTLVLRRATESVETAT